MAYTFHRLDTATRVRREELEADAPGWGGIATDRPQYAIFRDDGTLADWPLIDTYEEAVSDCACFNSDDDEQEEIARSETLWQARMSGDLSA